MRVIHSLLLLSSFGLRAAAAAGADAFLSSAGENKIGQLNEAVRSMAQSETAKASLWGDFSWSLTEGKDQPLHSWYVLAGRDRFSRFDEGDEGDEGNGGAYKFYGGSTQACGWTGGLAKINQDTTTGTRITKT